MTSPLRGLYGANHHVPVFLGKEEAGVAIPESMVTYGGRPSVFVVFKLVPKRDDTGAVFFEAPSVRRGQVDIKCTSVEVAAKGKMVTKSRLSKQEVHSLAVVDAKPSLAEAAAMLTSYLVQRLEKSTVHCNKCNRTFRMNVNMTVESAKVNKAITWSPRERRQYLATQRERGICTFSPWEWDNYVHKCRSWFADYVAWAKRCPACNRNTVHHKCMNCRRKTSECLANPCEWQRTKRAFWNENKV